MRYSNTTKCFYPKWGKYTNLPSDIVDVTEADFQKAMSKKADETLDIVGGKVVTVKKSKSREEAFAELKDRIIAKRQEKNAENFVYNGVTYISDEANIQGVKVRINGNPDSDPIPTFVGTPLESTWHAVGGIFTPFNCGQFREFAAAYYDHREKNFTNYTVLTIAATQAYSGGATAEQLDKFDITLGWD